ncbi:beta-lactamase [Aureococcus anophagefferens]|uniref:Beta-lactamase n=1 Tax=Aureococcus anophagefferens TaxID=44056 RepID=A0ABR1FXK6_AURAN
MAALDALSCGVDSAVASDDMVGSDEHLPRTRRAVEEGIAAGLHFGAQVSVFKDGVEVGDLAVGRRGPDGGPMTSDAILPWWSSVKPCLAVLAGLAVDRGHLRSLRDPVSRYVPEFAAGGKAAITIEDVLTHAAGLVCAGAAESHRGEPWDVVVAATCKAAPEWAPIGAKNGYQMGGAFHCVAEAVRRAWPGGRSYGELLRREVFEPVGATGCFCGVPFEMAGCGEMPAAGGGAFAGTFELSGGSAVDDGSRSLRALLSEDPAGAGRGPARGLAALYRRLLLDATDGDVPGRLLEAATARRMGETVHPSTFDVVQGCVEFNHWFGWS